MNLIWGSSVHIHKVFCFCLFMPTRKSVSAKKIKVHLRCGTYQKTTCGTLPVFPELHMIHPPPHYLYVCRNAPYCSTVSSIPTLGPPKKNSINGPLLEEIFPAIFISLSCWSSRMNSSSKLLWIITT